jgi:acyl dehydratase
MHEVRFDDVDGINALASDEFGAWGAEVEVTQEVINGFAELTGDRQWIHVDVERAQKESPFGGPIAHGFLTLSLLPGMASSPLTVTGQGSAVNYGASGLRFMAPVPAGSRLHARGRVVGAEVLPKGTLVTTEIEIAVVGVEKPSLRYGMQILYMAPRS